MTSNKRLSIIREFGNTDDYFEYDFSPSPGAGNVGAGQGGQGLLAEVSNSPILVGAGISLAMGLPSTLYTVTSLAWRVLG